MIRKTLLIFLVVLGVLAVVGLVSYSCGTDGGGVPEETTQEPEVTTPAPETTTPTPTPEDTQEERTEPPGPPGVTEKVLPRSGGSG